jgi:Tol biopolymer transport system component
VPIWQGLHPVISKDGKWLVMPLDDRLGTNIWVASTADGKLRQITDFGEKRTFIARRISWSSDGKWVFAAVGERRCRYRADGRASELEQPYRIRIPRAL